MSLRVLAGAAGLAILIGLGVAACQHQDDDVPPADSCDGIAYAVPAGPVQGTKPSSSKKNLDKAPAPVRRQPRTTVSKRPASIPTVTATVTHRPGHRPHGDIDLDLDGC
ncbi:hypothetical protein [Streptomyces olivochromogenes]|uniref:hypothetical protein n=1 Tax=Streptomyces olivochromogenes TaxID=1963 RepID=UPI00367AD851